MKKIFKSVSLITTIILTLFFYCVPAKAALDEPDVNAEGCVLLDASTGKILFGKNEEKQFEPASTTKVMTALVVLEKCNLDEIVTVQKDFTDIDGTAVGLLNGDKLTVNDLLHGMLLESGNDCAEALAEHVSGSILNFSKLMNAKAKELGALNTNFQNPSGLPEPQNITTAHDLALFMREAIKNPNFIRITNELTYTINLINDTSRPILVNNKDYLINKASRYYYPYATSGKNGYTTVANHTYVASAQNGDQKLVAAYLNATDKAQNFSDMKTVFDYGFNNFKSVTLYKKGDKVADYKVTSSLSIPIIAADDIVYVVPKDEENKETSTDIKIDQKDLSKESFKNGDKILKGMLYVNNEEYLPIDLCSGEGREYTPLLNIPKNAVNLKIPIICSVTATLIVLAGGLFIHFRKVKKRSKKRKKRRFSNKDIKNFSIVNDSINENNDDK
ncbi:serine hydrolase [Clostridium sp. BJN0001]|uniref:serine hydrolase n=1 Tax=Clostridium sp. BJN0001 TaxID=2930219 RepID=UPI001FD0BF73|nr:serine hydrolase [Clostridium sp. BJN0001]